MYQRILVPIDGSATSDRGLAEAIRLADMTHGRLRLIHVVDDLSFGMAMGAATAYSGDWMADIREGAAQVLAQARGLACELGVEADTVLYDNLRGSVHEMITNEATRWHADLIVLGTHGRRGVGRLMLGSTAENVLRASPVPVLLIRVADDAPKPVAADTVRDVVPLLMPEGQVAMQ